MRNAALAAAAAAEAEDYDANNVIRPVLNETAPQSPTRARYTNTI